jgi:hypothetical protein
MGTAFWIRRFLTVFVVAACVIGGAQWLKGHELGDSVEQGVSWAAVSATVFTVSRFWQARRGRHCALCRDTPEMRDAS